jgi:hypothetical protein
MFNEIYAPLGFKRIDRNDALMLELVEMTAANNQYFFTSDLFQGKIIFTSNRSTEMIGFGT